MIPERFPAKDFIRPPKVADDHIVSSIAQQGMIGQCLLGALEDIVAEDTNNAVVTAPATTAEQDNIDLLSNNANDDDGNIIIQDHHHHHQKKKNGSEGTTTNATTTKKKQMMPLTHSKIEPIMKEFGRAVSRSKYHHCSTSSFSDHDDIDADGDGDDDDDDYNKNGNKNENCNTRDNSNNNQRPIIRKASSSPPPRALLRGTLDHYNRFQGKWRLVVKGGLELKRRVTLPKNRRKTQRKGRPTLWEAVQQVLDDDDDNNKDGTKTNNSSGVVTLPGSLQILAYDDLC